MPKCPFQSHLVLAEQINESKLRAYNVGFDQKLFRLEPLVNVIVKVIPEFAFGYYEGTSIPITDVVDKLRDAAKRVYTTDNYRQRGEFGELILHLLLRDFCGSIPLVSKIYFKDADNVAVHGFDAVHVVTDSNSKQLWLGESKLYANGMLGVKDLINDLKKHLEQDYLRREFALVSTKLPAACPDIDYWRQLLHENQRLENILDRVCIPMVCTYTSKLFGNHTDNTAEYVAAFVAECKSLQAAFKYTDIHTDVDVLLMLLPVESKDRLVNKLDQRLKSMQSI